MSGGELGERVLVMVSGIETLGVPAGDQVATSGTVIDKEPDNSNVTVHLDVGFGGMNIVSVSREKVKPLSSLGAGTELANNFVW